MNSSHVGIKIHLSLAAEYLREFTRRSHFVF